MNTMGNTQSDITTFDPKAYRAEMEARHKGGKLLRGEAQPRQNDGHDEERWAIEDEVVRSLSVGEMKVKKAIAYTYEIDDRGKMDVVLPLTVKKAQRNAIEAEAKNNERKYMVMRRLQARMEKKGLEKKPLPPPFI